VEKGGRRVEFGHGYDRQDDRDRHQRRKFSASVTVSKKDLHNPDGMSRDCIDGSAASVMHAALKFEIECRLRP
jgi:hypothetical protein